MAGCQAIIISHRGTILRPATVPACFTVSFGVSVRSILTQRLRVSIAPMSARQGDSWSIRRSNSFLAFVHIEKAAGTTFIHILRRNFFLRYLDVRPMSPLSAGLFSAKDLRRSLRVNPFLRAFGGHSVRPIGDLCEHFPDIRFVTILRDPIRRYISQFLYGNAVLNLNNTFEKFLDDENTHNFQTKKLAGSPCVATAKSLLSDYFLAVGVVEQFDNFLTVLASRLLPQKFETWHEARNVGTYARAEEELFARYENLVRSVNQADAELYEHVQQQVTRQVVGMYPSKTSGGGSRLRGRFKSYADAAWRKLYCEPLTGSMRRVNGLPMKGSY
jgi:hypothetical protein